MTRWVAFAAVLALTGSACSQRSAPAETRAIASSSSVESPEPSIYPLAVRLRDQRGETIGLDVFRGHPVIISMFYGSCPTACPLLVSHAKVVEAQLPPGVRDDTRFLLVTFDPAHDTPPALAAIASARGLEPSRWTLATGSDDDVRQIAAVLGIHYRALPEGGFAHDSILTALDREGRPIARAEVPGEDVGSLAAAIRGCAR
jgi:protein SCO1/2